MNEHQKESLTFILFAVLVSILYFVFMMTFKNYESDSKNVNLEIAEDYPLIKFVNQSDSEAIKVN